MHNLFRRRRCEKLPPTPPTRSLLATSESRSILLEQRKEVKAEYEDGYGSRKGVEDRYGSRKEAGSRQGVAPTLASTTVLFLSSALSSTISGLYEAGKTFVMLIARIWSMEHTLNHRHCHNLAPMCNCRLTLWPSSFSDSYRWLVRVGLIARHSGFAVNLPLRRLQLSP